MQSLHDFFMKFNRKIIFPILVKYHKPMITVVPIEPRDDREWKYKNYRCKIDRI